MYLDRDKYPVGRLVPKQPPQRQPVAAPDPGKPFKCRAVGCTAYFAKKEYANGHYNRSCQFRDDNREVCTICGKEVATSNRGLEVHQQRCLEKQNELDDAIAARPLLPEKEWRTLTPIQRASHEAGFPIYFNGSETREVRRGAEYNTAAKDPFANREMIEALQRMIGVKGNAADVAKGKARPFSTAVDGADIRWLKQEIIKSCFEKDGRFYCTILGIRMGFGSYAEYLATIECMFPKECHSHKTCTVTTCNVQVAHFLDTNTVGDGINNIIAEMINLLQQGLLKEDNRSEVQIPYQAALDRHFEEVDANLKNRLPQDSGVYVDTEIHGKRNSATWKQEYNKQIIQLHLPALISKRVTDCIEADAEMNNWTALQLAMYRRHYRRPIITKMIAMLRRQRGLCAISGLPTGNTLGGQKLSIQRINNQGLDAAHFRLVLNTITGKIEVDCGNVMLIGRIGQGANGYDMNPNLFRHAMLHSRLPLARTDQQRAAVAAKYTPIVYEHDF